MAGLDTAIRKIAADLRKMRQERGVSGRAEKRAKRRFVQGSFTHAELETAVRRHAIAQVRVEDLTLILVNLRNIAADGHRWARGAKPS